MLISFFFISFKCKFFVFTNWIFLVPVNHSRNIKYREINKLNRRCEPSGKLPSLLQKICPQAGLLPLPTSLRLPLRPQWSRWLLHRWPRCPRSLVRNLVLSPEFYACLAPHLNNSSRQKIVNVSDVLFCCCFSVFFHWYHTICKCGAM